MKSNECSECSQPLIKSIEGIPLYYSCSYNNQTNNQTNNQNNTLATSSFGSSIQSPKNDNKNNNKNNNRNNKYDELCAKYNLIAFCLFVLVVIICLIIFVLKK
jgi:hypothetical protein